MLNFKSNQGAGKKSRARGFLKLSLPLVLALAPIGALSDQLVWVLGSFSDAGTAQQVAREVHDLTGQSGYVQTAVVNGRAVYRALIDPGVTDDAQARTTALLGETAYNQTWGFELDTDGENVAEGWRGWHEPGRGCGGRAGTRSEKQGAAPRTGRRGSNRPSSADDETRGLCWPQ